MLYVWLQSRLVRGRRDRSTLDLEINFFSSLTILWGSLTWTAFIEDLLMCPYTRYVCKLLQLFHHMRIDISRCHPFAWMFCRTWYSFPAFYVAPPFSCLWITWFNPLHWGHISRGEWNSLFWDTQPRQVMVCWQSVCASPILCQAVILIEWAWCSRITNMCGTAPPRVFW